MALASTLPQLGTEYNDFLFAPVGEDRNGLQVSVLSALARQNVDPWQEAETLTSLSVAAAIQRLAVFIAALPEGGGGPADANKIAKRAIALLPRTAIIAAPKRGWIASAQTITSAGLPPFNITKGKNVLFIVVLMITLTLGLQYLIGHRPNPAQQPGGVKAAPISQTGTASTKR
ncbi:MAG: hypothetical protein PHT60_01865 [Acidiphilium sp.]|nr:hypothetical protein [Acidiphilium sp.]MDD4934502.1 hypothetical protein [Acidiphilium sp.]